MQSRGGCFALVAAFVTLVIITLVAVSPLSPVAHAAVVADPQAAAVTTQSTASPARYSVAINPVLELLAGVQSQTEWIKSRGPQGEGSEYFRALQAFFAPYRDHPAMQISARLLKARFAYDAPVAFALHLGPLPGLELEHEYSEYVVDRAGGRDILEEFRLALTDLAVKSDFAAFVREWQPQYDQWTAAVAGQFDGERVISWLEEFSGSAGGEYHLILAPSMFPGGGYGVTVPAAEGSDIVYQVIRDQSGGGETEPAFPDGRSLEGLALHEWGHAFVNPAVDAYPEKLSGLARFFLPVFPAMNRQAYGAVGVYAHEQFLRAVTTLAAYELYGSAAAESDIAYNESRHFMLTRPIYEALKEYRANRSQYPTFASFVPAIYAHIAKTPGGWPLPLIAIAIVAVIGTPVLLIVRWRRRRRR